MKDFLKRLGWSLVAITLLTAAATLLCLLEWLIR